MYPNLCGNIFLEAQGYIFKVNVIYQYNQLDKKMQKNRRNLCTGNYRHVDIRYLFGKDRVDKGDFNIQYCWTEIVLADFSLSH